MIAGTENEDPAEYFEGHADVGELQDRQVNGAEGDGEGQTERT